jgi:hypothetical protein
MKPARFSIYQTGFISKSAIPDFHFSFLDASKILVGYSAILYSSAGFGGFESLSPRNAGLAF